MEMLDLSRNLITERSLAKLALFLSDSTKVDEVCLRNNDLSVHTVPILSPALTRMPAMRCIDLSGNLIGLEGFRKFNCLKSDCTLQELILNETGADDDCICVLASWLRRTPLLHRLSLSKNSFGSQGAFEIA